MTNLAEGHVLKLDQANTEAERSDSVRYRLLVESIIDYAIYMLDIDGMVASWNAGAQRFKGYDASEIIGQHFSRFYTLEDQAIGLPNSALEIARRDGRFETEGWRVRKDGSRMWTHVIIDPIWSPSRELLGYAKVTRDLTERKAAEAALMRSEEQFRLLVQGVTDYAIYMIDAEGCVASWNVGAQRIKGYSPDEIIGEHFSRFYLEEDRERGEPQRGLSIATRDGKFEKEGWRVRKDGSRFWASVVIHAVRNDQGELVGFAKVTRDITEMREAQFALDKAREALFQAQKLEAIGQLTGGVAHDFNNLLMVVISSLELLGKRLPQDDRLLSLVDNAHQAAQRGASLTQRMLAFARRQDLDPKPVDLIELVRGMSELLQRSLGPAIRIETRFPLSLAKVQTDANQLETALLNLALNARDAMPQGGPLTITAREQAVILGHPIGLKPGNYVCFAVVDAGEGMDEETLARAADPFFTTKGVGKGTGLGLSMVHGLAEQSGGRLTITSKKGAGTTVELWFPVAEVEAQAQPAGEPLLETPHDAKRTLRVLAVDDDALVLMNTAAMLEDEGHSVIEAFSGDNALKVLRSGEKVDLIITDQAMPRMTGLELIKLVKADWPTLPIIMATGYAELPAGAASALVRLSKPFTQAQLANAITTATSMALPRRDSIALSPVDS
jgi:PAS domain S-box-containing protein